jgi:hypothetical protein
MYARQLPTRESMAGPSLRGSSVLEARTAGDRQLL